MDVFFESKRLKNLLLSPRQLARKFGTENAKLIKRRLDNLMIARNLEEAGAVISSLHELKGNRAGTLSIKLRGGYRLIIAPAYEALPLKPDGGLDWRAVEAVVVKAVEDYHD